MGDLSFEIHPLPLVPVVIVLWLGNDEFPPSASLLLDSAVEERVPADIMWSTAMLSVEALFG